MLPVVAVQKRIPDGSIWQRYRAYRLPDREGVARVYLPAGTGWWNPLGGWTTSEPGVSLFHPERPFVVNCHGPAGAKRFYIDIVAASDIGPERIEYHDRYLDVLIDPAGTVREKDEHQLDWLVPAERAAVRRARDDVRARIAAGDPLFDPASAFFAVPDAARELPPLAAD
jgi:hypothetical protein